MRSDSQGVSARSAGIPIATRSRRSPKLSSWVVGQLEAAILSGQIIPGAVLPTEAELCNELEVSRTVVREALRTLSATGLVSVQQGRGTVVTEPQDEALGEALVRLLLRADVTLGDVIDARHLLDSVLTPIAASRRREEDWARLRATCSEFRSAVEAQAWETAHRLHLSFHVGILRSLHSPALELILRPMHQVILVSSTLASESESAVWDLDAHERLWYAIRDGSEAEVRLAVAEHYRALEDTKYAADRSMLFRKSATAQRALAALLRSDSDLSHSG